MTEEYTDVFQCASELLIPVDWQQFDPEVYRKCKGYLHERRVKNGTINT